MIIGPSKNIGEMHPLRDVRSRLQLVKGSLCCSCCNRQYQKNIHHSEHIGKGDAAELYVANNNSANSRMAIVGSFLSRFQMTLLTEATQSESWVHAQG